MAVLDERCVLDVREAVAYISLDLGGKFGAGENGDQGQREAEHIRIRSDRVVGDSTPLGLLSWI